jgi:hypothetical protein
VVAAQALDTSFLSTPLVRMELADGRVLSVSIVASAAMTAIAVFRLWSGSLEQIR